MTKKIYKTKSTKTYGQRIPVSLIVCTLIAVAILVLLLRSPLFKNFRTTQSETEQAFAAASPTVGPDSIYRYDVRRNGGAPVANFVNQPVFRWEFKCTTAASGLNAIPAVNNTSVFYMCPGTTAQGGGLYALRVTDGVQLWKNTSCTTNLVPQRMEVVGGVLYANFCNKATAFNISNGSIKWQYTYPSGFQPAAFSAPAITSDKAFFSVYKTGSPSESRIYAFKKTPATTAGELAWPMRSYANVTLQNIATNLDGSRLDLAGGTRIQQIRSDNGNTVWTKDRPGEHFFSPGSLRSGVTHVSTLQGKVYGFDKSTGNLASGFTTFSLAGAEAGQISPLLTIAKDQIALASDKGWIYSINLDTGALRWKKQYGSFTAGHAAPSAVMGTLNSNAFIYIGNAAGEVKAFAKDDGALKWTIPCTGTCLNDFPAVRFIDEVVLSGNRMFVGNEAGRLRVYSM